MRQTLAFNATPRISNKVQWRNKYKGKIQTIRYPEPDGMDIIATFKTLLIAAHLTKLMNAYQKLREKTLTECTREYKARGILVVRCERCQLKASHCICNYRISLTANVDFVLLMHRDEIFKPTNSGRLIADLFPVQTYAFCWSRTEPDEQLLSILEDPGRDCMIVFPAEPSDQRVVETHPQKKLNKRLTFILLDGTWRQGRRMLSLSQWLKTIPALRLNPKDKAKYSTRKAAHDNYLSTAESAALALAVISDTENSRALFNYFSLFDERYIAMKSNRV